MKGFALDKDGDAIVENNKIKMVKGRELIRQTVQTVLGTNKGEWFLNIEEGIDFNNLLGKKKSDEIIRNEILQGLQQVDSSFVLDSFKCDFDRNGRTLTVSFKAKNSAGEEITDEEVFE